MISATGYGEILKWIKTKSYNKEEAYSSYINKETLLKVLNTFTTANLQGVTMWQVTFATLDFQHAYENH